MTTMYEVCFCGRVGELADREPVVLDSGPGLRCPACGDVDELRTLSETLRLELWTDARERDLSAPAAVPVPSGRWGRRGTGSPPR